jgi:hypothetical protein
MLLLPSDDRFEDRHLDLARRVIAQRLKVLPLHEQKRKNIARIHASEEALAFGSA